jgi:hypothetical protein
VSPAVAAVTTSEPAAQVLDLVEFVLTERATNISFKSAVVSSVKHGESMVTKLQARIEEKPDLKDWPDLKDLLTEELAWRLWEQQIAELVQQARVPVLSSSEGFQRLEKLQAAVDAVANKCAADNTPSLTQLRKLVATLEESCKAKQREEEAQAAAAEKVEKVKATVKAMVSDVTSVLNSPTPNYSDPKFKEGVAILKKARSYVAPICGGTWNEWSATGECQVCHVQVDRHEKGLHCSNDGHRICWKCMSDNIDWDKLVRNDPRLFGSTP